MMIMLEPHKKHKGNQRPNEIKRKTPGITMPKNSKKKHMENDHNVLQPTVAMLVAAVSRLVPTLSTFAPKSLREWTVLGNGVKC